MPKSTYFDIPSHFLPAAGLRRLKSPHTLFITSFALAADPFLLVNLLFPGDDVCLSKFLYAAL